MFKKVLQKHGYTRSKEHNDPEAPGTAHIHHASGHVVNSSPGDGWVHYHKDDKDPFAGEYGVNSKELDTHLTKFHSTQHSEQPKTEPNHITIERAKELAAQGKKVWGR